MKKNYAIGFVLILIVIWGVASFAIGLEQNKEYVANVTQFSSLVSAFQNEDYNNALQIAESIEAVDPRSHDIPYMQAISNYHLGNHELAHDYFDKALEIHPYYVENNGALVYFGLNLIQLQRASDALIVYTQLQDVHIAPQNFMDYLELKSVLTDEGLLP